MNHKIIHIYFIATNNEFYWTFNYWLAAIDTATLAHLMHFLYISVQWVHYILNTHQ